MRRGPCTQTRSKWCTPPPSFGFCVLGRLGFRVYGRDSRCCVPFACSAVYVLVFGMWACDVSSHFRHTHAPSAALLTRYEPGSPHPHLLTPSTPATIPERSTPHPALRDAPHVHPLKQVTRLERARDAQRACDDAQTLVDRGELDAMIGMDPEALCVEAAGKVWTENLVRWIENLGPGPQAPMDHPPSVTFHAIY